MSDKMYTVRRVLKGIYWTFLGNPYQKRRMRQEYARLAASIFGDYPIGEDYKLWRTDKEFFGDYRRLSPSNPYSEDRKYVLREFARFTKDVDGAMAECGCYRGASAFFLAKELPDVELFLFDSFQGLSKTTNEDAQKELDHFSWKEGDLTATEKEVIENLKEFKKIKIYKGWIPERFNEVANKRFRLVHIDVDLYQPTLDSISFFYNRMEPEGVIVLDDYGFSTCPGAYKAVNEFMLSKPEHVLHLSTGQGVIIKKN